MHSLFIIVIGKILAILFGLYYFKSLSIAFRLILFQVVLALICESFARYLLIRHSFHYNNLWIFNWYLLCEMWLAGLAGKSLISNKIIKRIIPYLLIALTVLWAVNIYVEGMVNFANWCFIGSSIILVAIYIVVLFETALFKSQNIFSQPAFWLSLSIVLFFGCDLPYFGLRNYLISHNLNSLELKLYIINSVLNFIRYPLIAISFIFCGQNASKNAPLKLHSNVSK